MANSFPDCLFAIMQNYPENKVSSRISEAKESRMQTSKKAVRSTRARKRLLGVGTAAENAATPRFEHLFAL